jgi:hypothetical protein
MGDVPVRSKKTIAQENHHFIPHTNALHRRHNCTSLDRSSLHLMPIHKFGQLQVPSTHTRPIALPAILHIFYSSRQQHRTRPISLPAPPGRALEPEIELSQLLFLDLLGTPSTEKQNLDLNLRSTCKRKMRQCLSAPYFLLREHFLSVISQSS